MSVTSFERELTLPRPCRIDTTSMGLENGSFRNLHNRPQWKFDFLVHPAVLEAERLSFETAKIAFRVFVIVGNGFGALFREEHFLCAPTSFYCAIELFFLPSLVSKEKKIASIVSQFFLHTLSAVRVSSMPTGGAAEIGVQISTR